MRIAVIEKMEAAPLPAFNSAVGTASGYQSCSNYPLLCSPCGNRTHAPRTKILCADHYTKGLL